MAQLIDLGKIRFDYKGDYNVATQYELNDVVKENNNLYVYTASAASTGNAVTDTNYWDVMIENAAQSYVDTQIANLVDSAPGTLDTLNELAAALGDDANFSTTVTNSIATKLPLAGGTLTGALTTTDLTVNGALDIEEVKEKVSVSSQTSGTATVYATDQGVLFYNVDQLANRTINITGGSGITLDSILDAGQSYTVSVLMSQGSTAYYLDGYQVDGSPVTVKWQGGSAPSGGNASGIDVYTFTIIKTASATFTVLASQTQFA